MRAVWFNQLDFASLCRTSRLELAAAIGTMGHRLRIIGRYRRQKPHLSPLNPRPLLLKQWLPDPFGGVLFQLQVFFLAACEVVKKTDWLLVDHFCVPTLLPFALLSKVGLSQTGILLDVRSAPVDRVGSEWRYNVSLRFAKLLFDGLTVITDHYREDISQRFGRERSTIGVWGSGVREALFDPRGIDKAKADVIKSRLGVGDRLVMIYHGYLSPYRGLQETVRALAMLAREGDRQAVLVLLGAGPAAAEVLALAASHGVADAVRVLHSVDHESVPLYVSIADVGILPFPDLKWWRMSSPLKLMEYMAMEKPVILTDIPAHRAILGREKCAFYLPDNSPSTIARVIREVSRQKETLPELGRHGRAIVLQKFTWRRQAEAFLAYVDGLCERGQVNG